jgi:hypothetical protein
MPQHAAGTRTEPAVGAEGHVRFFIRDSDGRPARGTAWNAMAVNRVHWRPIKLVRAGRPESEFSKIGLANDRNIGTPGSPQKRRILSGRWRVFGQVLRSCGRHLALHVDDIFHRKPKFSGIARDRPVGDESAISLPHSARAAQP